MKIASLNLQHFKNYQSQKIEFSGHLNCLLGLNGAGKTNLLDAIHYLAFTKSAFNSVDSQNIQTDAAYFRIEGTFEAGEIRKVLCFLEKGQKKEFRKNDVSYDRISEHIGSIHAILHTPYDTELIRETSEQRRKWIDGCISQYDHSYLETLLQYQKYLKQRNSFLKQLDGNLNSNSALLLDTYDEKIIGMSKELGGKRDAFINEFNPFFSSNLEQIVPENEKCTIKYQSKVLDEGFDKEFKNSRQKDVIMQRTLRGCHRDDYIFELNGKALKKFGSQGQQKSFLIALRLGQFDHLKNKTSSKPILMLDDVFDKLDDERISKLVELINDKDRFDQIFITDARKERSSVIFAKVKEKKMFEVIDGNLTQL